MKFNQLNEKHRKKLALNNSHLMISDSEDDFTKVQKSKNDDLKERFIKALNIRNDDLKKQAKTADITHYKSSNRTEKA